MILLTKLDDSKVLVNVENIKYIESTPDTLISFINGDTSFVKESLDEIHSHVIKYKAEILSNSKV